MKKSRNFWQKMAIFGWKIAVVYFSSNFHEFRTILLQNVTTWAIKSDVIMMMFWCFWWYYFDDVSVMTFCLRKFCKHPFKHRFWASIPILLLLVSNSKPLHYVMAKNGFLNVVYCVRNTFLFTESPVGELRYVRGKVCDAHAALMNKKLGDFWQKLTPFVMECELCLHYITTVILAK